MIILLCPPPPSIFPGADAIFRVRVAALLDLYSILGQASKDLQNLQKLPWERQRLHMEMVKKLQVMTATLSASASHLPGSTVLRSPSAIREQLYAEDPQMMEARWPNLQKHANKLSSGQVWIMAQISQGNNFEIPTSIV